MHHLKRFLLMLLFCLMLSSCGESGVNESRQDHSVDRSVLLISSSVSNVIPLQEVRLQVSRDLASRSFNGAVEIDLSGKKQFTRETAISVPAYTKDGAIVFAAPLMEMTPQFNSDVISVRVKSLDSNMFSNALDFTLSKINNNEFTVGIPSLVLGVTLKNIYAERGHQGTAASHSSKPGLLTDAGNQLGIDTSLIDIQAEAILRAVFGFTTSHSSRFSVRPKMVSRSGIGSERVNEAFRTITNCLSDQISDIGNSYQLAADSCEQIALREIKDNVIGGISDFSNLFSSRASTLASMIGLTGTPSGNYIQRLVSSSQTTKFISQLVAFSYYADDDTPADERHDYINGRLTSLGKDRMYKHITSSLDSTTEDLLSFVGASDALELVMELDEVARKTVYDLESSLIDLNSRQEQWEQDRDKIISGDFNPEPLVDVQEVPEYIVTPTGQIPTLNISTPSEFCSSYPDFNSSSELLGFSSCEQYITPFFDPAYLETELKPAIERMIQSTESIVTACGDNVSTDQCDRALEQNTDDSDAFFSAIRVYEPSDASSCSLSYKSYDTSDPNISVCIWSSIVYVPNGSSCYPGSRETDLDLDDLDVCLYYSRDYIQSDGLCRENYSLVQFLGSSRCRWSDIPLVSDVIYVLDKTTGETFTIER